MMWTGNVQGPCFYNIFVSTNLLIKQIEQDTTHTFIQQMEQNTHTTRDIHTRNGTIMYNTEHSYNTYNKM